MPSPFAPMRTAWVTSIVVLAALQQTHERRERLARDKALQPFERQELEDGVVILEPQSTWMFSGLPVPVGDHDGDGVEDQLIRAQEQQPCGSGPHRGTLRVVSGADGSTLRGLGGSDRYRAVALETRVAGEPFAGYFVARNTVSGFSALDYRVELDGPLIWELKYTRSPVTYVSAMLAVPDVDRDGVRDLVVGAPVEPTPLSAEQVGRVLLFSGKTGQLLWSRHGALPRERFGSRLAALDDWGGDGAVEIAVFADDAGAPPQRRVEVLDGRTGRTLRRIGVGKTIVRRIASAGDLDGDGRVELLLDAWYGESLVVNPVTKAPLELAGDGWMLEWGAPPARDFDGDGWDDLVIGRRQHETGERRISVVSMRGLRETELEPPDLDRQGPDRSLRHGVSANDFDGDGSWDLAFWIAKNSWVLGADYELRFVPGAIR